MTSMAGGSFDGLGVMRDWCRHQLAEVFQVPLYFSWLEGGFEGELLKDNAYSRPHHVETHEGLLVLPRDHQRASPSTRLRFPQQSPSLQTRWCSSALKIDVGRRALNNQDRFRGKKILFVTGERREESANRAKYNQLEAHVVTEGAAGLHGGLMFGGQYCIGLRNWYGRYWRNIA